MRLIFFCCCFCCSSTLRKPVWFPVVNEFSIFFISIFLLLAGRVWMFVLASLRCNPMTLLLLLRTATCIALHCSASIKDQFIVLTSTCGRRFVVHHVANRAYDNSSAWSSEWGGLRRRLQCGYPSSWVRTGQEGDYDDFPGDFTTRPAFKISDRLSVATQLNSTCHNVPRLLVSEWVHERVPTPNATTTGRTERNVKEEIV